MIEAVKHAAWLIIAILLYNGLMLKVNEEDPKNLKELNFDATSTRRILV